MIQDPELRKMLEEEAKIVRKEYENLSIDNSEALAKKRKLKNRYEEIERLLGLRAHQNHMIMIQQKRHNYFFVVLAICLAALVAFCAIESRAWRAEISRIERMVLEQVQHGEVQTP
ncbi:MAG: hypothetical protein GWP08_12765 [Nitrospiraceae bacterium]|nr:hypothetical protein [Nitrospiraceae bacterium]